MLGSIISGVGSLVGGLLGSSSASKAAKKQEQIYSQQRQDQLDAMQHGIRWRVNDAQQAGIHPLFALGANVPTYSPMSANFQGQDFSWIDRMGQNLGRAATQGATESERRAQASYVAQKRSQELRKGEAEIALLNSQVRTANQPGGGPGMPNEGGNIVPGQNVVRRPGAPPAAFDPTFKWTVATDHLGRKVYTRSGPQVGIDEDPAGFFANLVGSSAPPFKAPPGKTWRTDYAGRMWLESDKPIKTKRGLLGRWYKQFNETINPGMRR